MTHNLWVKVLDSSRKTSSRVKISISTRKLSFQVKLIYSSRKTWIWVKNLFRLENRHFESKNLFGVENRSFLLHKKINFYPTEWQYDFFDLSTFDRYCHRLLNICKLKNYNSIKAIEIIIIISDKKSVCYKKSE